MISAYHSLVSYPDDDWEDYLTRICMYDVFKDLLPVYPDKVKLKCVIRFILYAYSIESDKIILSLDWRKNKIAIFEDTCMPVKGLYEDLVLLKNDVVVKVVHRWLEWQDSQTFSELMMLKELKMELQLAANTDIRKSSGETDYTQKYLNTTYVSELRKKIKDLESELIQNNNKLKDAVKEVRSVGKNKNTLGVEKFAI